MHPFYIGLALGAAISGVIWFVFVVYGRFFYESWDKMSNLFIAIGLVLSGPIIWAVLAVSYVAFHVVNALGLLGSINGEDGNDGQ